MQPFKSPRGKALEHFFDYFYYFDKKNPEFVPQYPRISDIIGLDGRLLNQIILQG